MTRAIDLWRRSPGLCVALAIALVVAVRLAIIVASPLQLGPDEAQYWRWSRTLDWGYYSKPPLIAWIIWLTTSVFGNAEWAVRLSSPILHGIAALALFALGRAMSGPKAGAWAAAVYLLMPGVFLSSVIMSTDAVLLTLWSVALFALWRMREKPTLLRGFLFGLALGVGMLAKYAALYLLAGAAIAAIIDAPTRRALLSLGGLTALAGLALAVAPNLAWNAANKFATVSHTADNADWSNAKPDLIRGFEFLVDQMGVFGPITLIALLVGGGVVLARLPQVLKARDPASTASRDLWLLAFVLPPLMVILVQAVISRAHANWAATAYPAAAVLIGCWIADASSAASRLRYRTMQGGLAINALIGLLFCAGAVAPSFADSIGVANSLKRVRGWRELTYALRDVAVREHATALMFDERELWHGVDYYGRSLEGLPPVRAWQRGNAPHSFAEEAGKVQPGEDAQALVIAHGPDFIPFIRNDFREVRDLGELSIPLDARHSMTVYLFIASGYQPVHRTPEYEAEVWGEEE
jgi:hypothetical protein